jgi:fatty-acid peroxygenase
MKTKIPHLSPLQAFAGLLEHGYQFIQHTCQTYGSRVFALRLVEEDILCFYGFEASEVFYDSEYFERCDARLRRVGKTPIDSDGVRALDGAAHAHRKEMFMSVASPERIRQLAVLVAAGWRTDSERWQQMSAVNVHARAREVFCKAACAWTGIPLRAEEVTSRADDLYSMVDPFGAMGRRRSGRKARKRVEAWITKAIEDYRNSARLEPDTALHMVAMHRDAHARLLDSQVAATELINVLYPIIAIATFVAFAALALHEHPYCAERVRTGDLEYIECFIQEVRRLYPFAPFVSARVRKDFVWKGYTFSRGTLVLLDIYGTNHDGTHWHLPEQFDPGRFYRWNGDPFDYIPHGGGNVLLGHRCAGEALTTEVLKVTLLHLTQKVKYNVPMQDLSVDMTHIPTMPKSGFILEYIGATGTVMLLPALQSQLTIAYTVQGRLDL